MGIDRVRNRYHYYRIELGEDLWGDLCVVKTWGRIGHSARRKLYWPRSQRDLARLLQSTIIRRKYHHYRID